MKTKVTISLDIDFDSIEFGKKYNPSWWESEKEALRPPPDLLVSDWCDEHRYLPPGPSRSPGYWQTSTTPYLKFVLNLYNNPDIRHIVLCFGKQTGKTEVIYNYTLFAIDMEPYSTMLVYPTTDITKEISRTRVRPSIELSKSVKDKIPNNKDFYQLREMHFPGMILYMVGANSPASVEQKPVRNVFRDEIDNFPEKVGKRSNLLAITEERTKSFWDIRKILDVSSPTIEGWGIWKELQSCDLIYFYHLPCPFCGILQKLEFDQIKWSEFPPDIDWKEKRNIAKNTAFYYCKECNQPISDDYRASMLDKGKWIPNKELNYKPEKIGCHLSSFYSPWLTWGDMAAKFINALEDLKENGEIGTMMNFVNAWKAEPWVEKGAKIEIAQILERKCELPPMTVPKEAVALTAGIDPGKYGFHFTIWAFSNKYESWLIHYGYLISWEEIEELIFNTYFPMENSHMKMMIWRAAMDIGGGIGTTEDWTRTEEIKHWIRNNGRGVLWGIKGMSVNNTSSRIRYSYDEKEPKKASDPVPNKPVQGGFILWLLDTYQLKEIFFWRLTNTESDIQTLHLHSETSEDYAKHLLGEEKRRTKSGKFEYARTGANHWLDCSVYAHACADPQWNGGVRGMVNPTNLIGGNKNLPTFENNRVKKEVTRGRIINPKARR